MSTDRPRPELSGWVDDRVRPQDDLYTHVNGRWLWQAAGLVQKPADQRRLAVIDMADDDDAHLRAALGRQGRSCVNIMDACGFGHLDIHRN